MEEFSPEARSMALVGAFWALARSLQVRGVLDVSVFFAQGKAAHAQLVAEGEEAAALALEAILGPLFADWTEAPGRAG